MVDGKIETIKKFLKNYSVAVTATVGFIIILLLLIFARLGALASIADITNLNPLITSEENELVAQADANGLIEVVKVEEGDTKGDSKVDGDKSTSTSSSGNSGKSGGKSSSGGSSSGGSSGSSGGSSGGSTGSGGGSGSGGGDGGSSGGGGGSNEPEAPQPFSAAIGQMRHFGSNPVSLLGSCSITHDFEADIHGANSPGTVTYRWVRSDGTQTGVLSLSFDANDSKKTAKYQWKFSGASSNKWVRFVMLTPSQSEEKLDFRHGCGLLL